MPWNPSGNYHGNGFAKPYDERTELGAIGCLVAYLYFEFFRLQFADVLGVVRLETGSYFGQLTMQVNHLCTSGTLVQIVHILSDDRYMKTLLEFRYQLVKPNKGHAAQTRAAVS